MMSMLQQRTAPRLPRPERPRRRAAEVVQGLLAFLALAGLLIGVPYALVTQVGWPLPRTAPDRSWLTVQIDGQILLNVFAVAVWLAWAYFLVCVLVEARAERKGLALSPRVPLGGGGQAVARKLVAAVLILISGAAIAAPAATAANGPDLGRPAASISRIQQDARQQAVVPQQASHDQRAADATTTVTTTAKSGGLTAQAGQEKHEVTKLYEVKPPEGRHYECLWDIAERYLGSGTRYKELVALNKGKIQPDGRRLGDPDLIHPGWVLVMPADATGPGLRIAEHGPALGQHKAAPSDDTGRVAQQGGDQAKGDQGSGDHVAVDQDAQTVRAGGGGAEQVSAADQLVGFGVGGAALAAGLLVALARRRGIFGSDGDADVEVDLRLAADLPAAQRLDRALRDLSRRMTEAGRPVPWVYAASQQAGDLVLALSPADPHAPAPWTADPTGRTWTLPADAPLPGREELDATVAPYPLLTTVGATKDGAVVLVNLEAAAGLVSLGGDDAVAREVVASMAVENGTNLWSDGVAVTLVGFGDDLASIAPDRMRRSDDLDDVITELQRRTAPQAAVCERPGVGAVLRGRQVLLDRRLWNPELIVLSGPPTPEQAQRLATLAADPARAVSVLAVGDLREARWRFAVSSDGELDATVLGLQLQAQRLAPEQYLPVARMLEAVSPGSAAPTSMSDGAGSGSEPDPFGGGVLPDERMADHAVRFPVEVRVLGPVEVEAPGSIDVARRELATEIVVATALHPEGIHPNVLASAVWPRGVTEAVQAAAIGHVQAWLGEDDKGRPRLRQRSDGRWVLADDVRVDVRVVAALAARASGEHEVRDLAAALAFVRGEAWAGLPAGRYAWLARGTAERDSRRVVVSVAKRLSRLAAARGDEALTRDSLRVGLRMVPAAQTLWRDLLRFEDALGGEQATTPIVAEMYHVLRAHGVTGPCDPETDALVDELAPGLRTVVA